MAEKRTVEFIKTPSQCRNELYERWPLVDNSISTTPPGPVTILKKL